MDDSTPDDEIWSKVNKRLDPQISSRVQKLGSDLARRLQLSSRLLAKRATLAKSLQLLAAGRVPSGSRPFRSSAGPTELDQPAGAERTLTIVFPADATHRQRKEVLHMQQLTVAAQLEDAVLDAQVANLSVTNKFDAFVKSCSDEAAGFFDLLQKCWLWSRLRSSH